MKLSAALALGATAAVLAAAQDQPPQPTFRTEANYVRVDVYPTRDGAPVTDLTPGRLRSRRGQSPPESRAVRARPHPERSGLGRPPRAQHRGGVATGRFRIRERACSCCSSTSSTSKGDASRTIARPLVNALNRLDRPGRLRRRDDARHVRTRHHVRTPQDVDRGRPLARLVGRTRSADSHRSSRGSSTRYCYPGIPPPAWAVAPDQGIAQEMILRRREKQTLDALEDLSIFLRGVREERKAVITITDGWRLYATRMRTSSGRSTIRLRRCPR